MASNMKALMFGGLFICWARHVHALDGTTPTTPSMNMTTPIFHITDIPQEKVDTALNIERGVYEPTIFLFNNGQQHADVIERFPYKDEKDRLEQLQQLSGSLGCTVYLTDCVSSLAVATPVCAYNHALDEDQENNWWGYMSAKNICEVYFDNCRRGYRVWRVIDYGKCAFIYRDGRDNVAHTRRTRTSLLILKMMRSLKIEYLSM